MINKPTLGGGIKPADGDYQSQEPNAIVFSAYGVEFNKAQLDYFIEKNKDYVAVSVDVRLPFTLTTHVVGGVFNFNSNNDMGHMTYVAQCNNDYNNFEEAYKILNLFDPTYFNKYYNINQDTSFMQACDNVYGATNPDENNNPNNKPVEDYHTLATCQDQQNFNGNNRGKEGSLDDLPTVEEQYPNGTQFEQLQLLKEVLREFSPEAAYTINNNPVVYTIELIKQFIQTQKDVDESIRNNGQVILVRSDVDINNLSEDELKQMISDTTEPLPDDLNEVNEQPLTPLNKE